jgi:putative component of membrane protein insertase Oxa1/YidC/SpoIIIJ protein YidD
MIISFFAHRILKCELNLDSWMWQSMTNRNGLNQLAEEIGISQCPLCVLLVSSHLFRPPNRSPDKICLAFCRLCECDQVFRAGYPPYPSDLFDVVAATGKLPWHGTWVTDWSTYYSVSTAEMYGIKNSSHRSSIISFIAGFVSASIQHSCRITPACARHPFCP